VTDTSEPTPAVPPLGLIDRSDRARVEVGGPDRAKFLHNLTTNDVKRLAVGAGQEAFVTSPQGKTLGFVTLLATEDRILLRTDPGGLEFVLPHLRKYGVFDDITLDEVSDATFELHVAGAKVDDLAARLGASVPEAHELSHQLATIADRTVRVVRESPTGRGGLTLIGPRADGPAVAAAVREAGAALGLQDLPADLFESLRIEAGTPVFGRDVVAENLPQEIGRDSRAISFVKGCYLGQETVARIDALGHVNRILKGLLFHEPGVPPEPGTALMAGGRKVGAITSSSPAPGGGVPIALALVRVADAAAGTELEAVVAGGNRTAVVCDLPIARA
jgi:folate-binding protein YgfZ